MDSQRLRSCGFEPNVTVEVHPPYPPDGTWDCPVVGFDVDGRAHPCTEFDGRAALVARVQPAERPAGVGLFDNGGLGRVEGAFAGPGSGQLCVVAEGTAYLVDVDSPTDGAVVVGDQVQHVAADTEHRLLLLAGDTDLVAVGVAGLAWRSPRVALDGLRIAGTGAAGIQCHAWLGDHDGATHLITIDPRTGRVAAGPVLPDRLQS